ncbi:MAG: hypothetical protein ACOY3Y_19420 [Acidobacteriota bacterium]
MRGTIVASAVVIFALAGTVAAVPQVRQKRPTPTPTSRATARPAQQVAPTVMPAQQLQPVFKGPCGVESEALQAFRPSSSQAAAPAALTAMQAATQKKTTQLDVPHLIGSLGQSVPVRATLTVKAEGMEVSDHTVHFWLDTAYLGNARTNAQGRAEIPYTIETMTPRKIRARYYGTEVCYASLGENNLEMRKAGAKLTLKDPPSSVRVGMPFRLRGWLARITDNKPIDGREIVVSLDGSPQPPLASSTSGDFAWDWTPPNTASGNHGVVVKFAGDTLYTAASASHVFAVVPAPKSTWLTLYSAEGKVGENKVVLATLFSTPEERWRPGIELKGVTVRLWRDRGPRYGGAQFENKQLGSGVTDYSGTARINIKVDDEPMQYDLHGYADVDTAMWLCDHVQTATLNVTKSPVTIQVTGPASARIGDTIVIAAVLKRTSDGAPLGGLPVSLDGAGTKNTMNNGAAGFNLTVGSIGGTGPRTIAAKFYGTSRYLAGTGSMTINVLPKTN